MVLKNHSQSISFKTNSILQSYAIVVGYINGYETIGERKWKLWEFVGPFQKYVPREQEKKCRNYKIVLNSVKEV